MAAQRPSDLLKNKTDVNQSVDRSTEATAADFIETGEIFEDHANRIDKLERADELAPFYGFFSTLEVLQAAFPAAEINGFAVIDPGNGNPQQIAKFVDGVWTIPDTAEQLLYFNSKLDFPDVGLEKTWYIAQDSGIAYLYINGSFKAIGADGENGLTAYEIAVIYGFEGTEQEWLNSLKGYLLIAEDSLYIDQANNLIRQNLTDFDIENEWHTGDSQIFDLIDGVTWIRGVFRQGQKLRPQVQWRLLESFQVEIIDPLVDGDFISIEVQHFINLPE